MRTIIITITIAALMLFAGIGCNDKTELAWKNDAGNNINDIVWANGDQMWSKPDGYVDGTRTEFKEVNKLNGTVIASINDGDEFKEGNVTIAETSSNSLSLNEGSSEVYTIKSVTTQF